MNHAKVSSNKRYSVKEVGDLDNEAHSVTVHQLVGLTMTCIFFALYDRK